MNIHKIVKVSFIIITSAGILITGCTQENNKQSSDKKVLYYEDAMKDSKVSPEDYNNGVTQCPVCKMDLKPVYAEENTPAAEMKGHKEKKILHYTDAMHPSIKVSPEEYDNGTTQCPICNMDLYPVYEAGSGKETKNKGHKEKQTVKLSQREIALAGIKTFKADYYHLSKEIVAVGKVAYDPELVVAEKEYITAVQAAQKMKASHISESKKRADRLLEEASYKLKLMGLNDDMINELSKTKKVHNNLILPEKTVWVYADIYEFELGLIEEGQEMTVEATAYPGEYFKGKIRAIDSVLNPKTRSVRIRAEVYNRDMKLKPDMYVKVIISKHLGKKLVVPRDAVLDTGKRKLVYVDKGAGRYMQHEVQSGYEAVAIVNTKKERMIIIKKGVVQGDMVVVKANFLIDSQSQLSGPASAQYGGALEGTGGEQKKAPGHQH